MFVKGKSGNPGGKPKELRNVQLAARKISPRALLELKKILNSKDAGSQAKIAAAQVVLDRAWGKAPQAITGEGGGPVLLSWESNTPAPVPPVKSVETS